MIQLMRETYVHQYGAALKMLENCIHECNPEHWRAIVGRYPVWHVVYHTLFYTDLYLSPREDAFRPQPFHRQSFFDHIPWTESGDIPPDQPMEKADLLGYVQTCMNKAFQILNGETEESLRGESGFSWLRFSRAQLHIYNIRHIQHHTGQISALLSRQQGKAVGWVGSHSPPRA